MSLVVSQACGPSMFSHEVGRRRRFPVEAAYVCCQHGMVDRHDLAQASGPVVNDPRGQCRGSSISTRRREASSSLSVSDEKPMFSLAASRGVPGTTVATHHQSTTSKSGGMTPFQRQSTSSFEYQYCMILHHGSPSSTCSTKYSYSARTRSASSLLTQSYAPTCVSSSDRENDPPPG